MPRNQAKKQAPTPRDPAIIELGETWKSGEFDCVAFIQSMHHLGEDILEEAAEYQKSMQLKRSKSGILRMENTNVRKHEKKVKATGSTPAQVCWSEHQNSCVSNPNIHM
jgi:hypothetical protein